MLVKVMTDDTRKATEIKRMIDDNICGIDAFSDRAQSLTNISAVVVDFDLQDTTGLMTLRTRLGRVGAKCRKIFVLTSRSRWSVAQAYALGATHIIYRPLVVDELRSSLLAGVRSAETTTCQNASLFDDMAESALALASLFAAVSSDNLRSLEPAKRATHLICKQVSTSGLPAWLAAVRRHHQGTFQHCLLVSGVAVSFALKMKMSTDDVELIGLAATLHDIGKAKVPVDILDKPGRLDPDEESIVRKHPRDGYDALKDIPRVERGILDAVLHHHEFMDGSGYPEGLKASDITDIVRILTISDIFGALVEDRSYRPAMESGKAYGILQTMGEQGKLEGALVREFGSVATTLQY